MTTLLVTPKNNKELKFISELLTKLGIDVNLIKREDREDYGLLKTMLQAKPNQKVSRKTIMKKLKTK